MTIEKYFACTFILQVNTCDQNVNRCSELIEITSRLQGELFTILNLCCAEGECSSFLLKKSCEHDDLSLKGYRMQTNVFFARHVSFSMLYIKNLSYFSLSITSLEINIYGLAL